MNEQVKALLSLAKTDRFSAIFPESLESEVLSNLDELMQNLRVTCILIHKVCTSTNKFYHATFNTKVHSILDGGLRVFKGEIDNSSFGGDLIYTFQDKWRLKGAEAIIEVTYQGEYYEAVAEMDKPASAQHACGLFPASIVSVREVLNYSSIVPVMVGTNERVFAQMKAKQFNHLVWASNNLETVAHYYEGCVALLLVELLPEEEMRYAKNMASKPEHYSYGISCPTCPSNALWYSFSSDYLAGHLLAISEVFPDLSAYQEQE